MNGDGTMGYILIAGLTMFLTRMRSKKRGWKTSFERMESTCNTGEEIAMVCGVGCDQGIEEGDGKKGNSGFDC